MSQSKAKQYTTEEKAARNERVRYYYSTMMGALIPVISGEGKLVDEAVQKGEADIFTFAIGTVLPQNIWEQGTGNDVSIDRFHDIMKEVASDIHGSICDCSDDDDKQKDDFQSLIENALKETGHSAEVLSVGKKGIAIGVIRNRKDKSTPKQKEESETIH